MAKGKGKAKVEVGKGVMKLSLPLPIAYRGQLEDCQSIVFEDDDGVMFWSWTWW